MGLFSSSFRLLFSTLEGSASQVSEQGLRKALYQKILAAFPDGWMSSGQISREGERQ
jgi:Ubinuclein conserved middle domain